MSEVNKQDDKDCGSRRCSSADPNDPHLALAAAFIRRVFVDCGHTWACKVPSVNEIAEFMAKEINLMRRGNLTHRSLGGIMFCRDTLTNIVEIGTSVTHHFPDIREMVPMVKWGYGDCPFCSEKDELFWVDGDRSTLQCGTCIDG